MFNEWQKGGDGDSGQTFSGESASGEDIRPKLLLAAQKAKASAPTNKHVLKTIKKVMDKVLKDDHLCSKCLSQYAPGDRYCSCCGVKVVVYGICPRCRTISKGKFCAKCGTTKAAADKMIKEQMKRRNAWRAKAKARRATKARKNVKKIAVKPAVKPAVKATK